jgi:hypothetical protein
MSSTQSACVPARVANETNQLIKDLNEVCALKSFIDFQQAHLRSFCVIYM